MVIVATTEAEIVEAIRSNAQLRVMGSSAHEHYRPPARTQIPQLRVDVTGIVELMPDDQVVQVRAGTSMAELQGALSEVGQCLPFAEPFEGGQITQRGTIGGHVAMSLPHLLEAKTGTWREWVIGATIVTADGTVVKAGSRAVKNVAGYDMHKFMVGSRGTLGVLFEVILRTYPLRSVPAPEAVLHGPIEGAFTIQRTMRSDFNEAVFEAGTEAGLDLAGTSTLWRPIDPTGITRFAHDWVITAGDTFEPIDDENLIPWMKRAKEILDPTNRLNPGEFGLD